MEHNYEHFCGNWTVSHYSAEFTEHADIRFKNVPHIMKELWAKTAENSATCWSFLVCELQGPLYTAPVNFMTCYGMGTAPNIKLDQSATLWWIGKTFSGYPQDSIDNNSTKFCVNYSNGCGDTKYFIFKSAI